MTPTHIDTPIRRNAIATTPMNNQFASRVFEVSAISFVCVVFERNIRLFVCFRSWLCVCVRILSIQIFVFIPKQNDDEAERRESRARVSMANDSSIIQHKEGLDNCLKIFNDNVRNFFFVPLSRNVTKKKKTNFIF